MASPIKAKSAARQGTRTSSLLRALFDDALQPLLTRRPLREKLLMPCLQHGGERLVLQAEEACGAHDAPARLCQSLLDATGLQPLYRVVEGEVLVVHADGRQPPHNHA